MRQRTPQLAILSGAALIGAYFVFLAHLSVAEKATENMTPAASPNPSLVASPEFNLLGTVQANQTATAEARATSSARAQAIISDQATQTAIAEASATSAAETAIVMAATEIVSVRATAEANDMHSQATIAAIASENEALETALVGMATSQAEAELSVASLQATNTALSNQVVQLEATINAVPTATPTPVPTATPTPPPTSTPAPTSTPIPTPTPTPPPESGTVLYQADGAGGFEQWSFGPDWQVFNGMLVSSGAEAATTVSSPYQLDHSLSYAIEAEVQFVTEGGYSAGFRIPVRSVDGVPFTAGVVTTANSGRRGFVACIWGPGDRYAYACADVDPFAWHVYRVEIDGNTMRLLIDGAIVLEMTDNRLLTDDGSRTAVIPTSANGNASPQMNIRAFRIVVL